MEGPTSPEDERQTPFRDPGGLTTSRLMPLVSRRRFSRPPSFAEARNSTQFVSNLRLDNLAPCFNPTGGIRTVAPPLLKVLKDPKSARKVSYDEPFAVPKGYSMSFDRQETRSTRCVVGPVISALKAITSQAEGAAMDARGASLARRRFRARDYRLADRRAHCPLENSRCRREIPETDRRSRQPG